MLQCQLEAAARDLPGAVLATRKFFGGGCYMSTLWGFLHAWASHMSAAGANLWPGCSWERHAEQSAKAVTALFRHAGAECRQCCHCICWAAVIMIHDAPRC